MALAGHLRVVGSTRSPEKAARLRELGVEVHVSDAPDELRESVDDLEAEIVLNHLGGPFTAVGMAALSRGGRMVVCGRTAGNASDVDIGALFWQHKRVIGSSMGTQLDLERLVSLIADGMFDPVVGAEYSLEEAPVAFEAMRERTLFGKAVIRPGA